MNSEHEMLHREKVIDYYNVTHRYYQELWHREGLGLHYGLWLGDASNRIEAIIKENEYLAHLANVQSGDIVLDAGCGIGGSGVWLEKHRGARVIGLNIVNKQLSEAQRIAQKRTLAKQYPLRADYHSLPVADDAVDVYWSLESIEHASSVVALIQEAYRVVKPGGRIIIAGTFKGEREISDDEQKQLDVGMRVAGAFNDFQSAHTVMDCMTHVGFAPDVNLNVTPAVMESARQMKNMCRWGLPVAKVLANSRLVSPLLIDNNQWGVYQEGLFRSGATEYHILLANKPQTETSHD